MMKSWNRRICFLQDIKAGLSIRHGLGKKTRAHEENRGPTKSKNGSYIGYKGWQNELNAAYTAINERNKA